MNSISSREISGSLFCLGLICLLLVFFGETPIDGQTRATKKPSLTSSGGGNSSGYTYSPNRKKEKKQEETSTPATPTEPRFICPQCGFEGDEGDGCPACNVPLAQLGGSQRGNQAKVDQASDTDPKDTRVEAEPIPTGPGNTSPILTCPKCGFVSNSTDDCPDCKVKLQ